MNIEQHINNINAEISAINTNLERGDDSFTRKYHGYTRRELLTRLDLLQRRLNMLYARLPYPPQPSDSKLLREMLEKVEPILEMVKGSSIKITPSQACKSEYGSQYADLLSMLNLLQHPVVRPDVTNEQCTYPKFTFNWKHKTESDSYNDMVNYLQTLGINGAVIGDGNGLTKGLLCDVDIYPVRPRAKSEEEMRSGLPNASYTTFNIRYELSGRSDIFVHFKQYPQFLDRLHCNYCIEIKTVEDMTGGLEAQSVREAILELIGLNVDHPFVSSVVILTNLVDKHYVMYITLGENPRKSLSFNLRTLKFESFPKAVWWVEKQLKRGNHTVDLGRRPSLRDLFQRYHASLEEGNEEDDSDLEHYDNVTLIEKMDVDALEENDK